MDSNIQDGGKDPRNASGTCVSCRDPPCFVRRGSVKSRSQSNLLWEQNRAIDIVCPMHRVQPGFFARYGKEDF